MGITKEDCRLLFHLKNVGVSYADTLTLGRQKLYVTKADMLRLAEKHINYKGEINETKSTDTYAEVLFEILGAKQVNSLDYSNYEGATITHDLNVALPDKHKNSFSVVIDSGTLEHVFNFPVAIKNCMDMLKLGGHFVGITPTNNFMGHGFYQFSPELYYRIFSAENGFRINKMLVRVAEDDSVWYSVADPEVVKSRVQVVNEKPMFLVVLAEKFKNVEVFKNNPYQSDYSVVWNSYKEKKNEKNKSILVKKLKSIVPLAIVNILKSNSDRMVNFNELGTVDSNHFKKVEM